MILDEKQIVALVMLDNYRNNNNKWICQLDVQGGYEINKNGVIHVYYPQLSRRISDIKLNGKPLLVDKWNYMQGAYTGYRLNSKVLLKDIQEFIDGKNLTNIKKASKIKEVNLFAKMFDKLFSND